MRSRRFQDDHNRDKALALSRMFPPPCSVGGGTETVSGRRAGSARYRALPTSGRIRIPRLVILQNRTHRLLPNSAIFICDR
jgi:hypothetical protein